MRHKSERASIEEMVRRVSKDLIIIFLSAGMVPFTTLYVVYYYYYVGPTSSILLSYHLKSSTKCSNLLALLVGLELLVYSTLGVSTIFTTKVPIL